MLSILPEETRAVLIGSSIFPEDEEHLPPLPAVKNNVEALAEILANSQIIGIPRKNLICIIDESNSSKVAQKLAQVAKEAEDTLIVYYAGHGLIGRSGAKAGKLFLAVKETTDSGAVYNALQFEVIQDAIRESPAKKKVLIIDCCFSGRALPQMGNSSNILAANIDIKGVYVIASAPANKPSIAPEGEKYTAFSGKLIKILTEGLNNQNKVISLEEIYEFIRAELIREGMPEPQRANLHDANKINIAFNRKFRAVIYSNTIIIGDADDPIVYEYRLVAKQLIEEELSTKWNALFRKEICPGGIPSVELCGEAVYNCGLYVILLGHFYGSIYDEENLSHTEYEFRFAEKAGKKIVVFLLPSTPVLPSMNSDFFFEQARLISRQEEFRKYIESKVSNFTIKYILDLNNFKEEFRIYLDKLEQELKQQDTAGEVPTTSSFPPHSDFVEGYTHLNYDRRPISSARLKALDDKLTSLFLEQPQARAVLRRAGLLRATREEHLQLLGVLDNDSGLTVGGFLCFAPQHLLADKFAACALQMVVYSDTQRAISKASPEFVQDNLLNLFEIGMNFLNSEGAGLRRTGRIGTSERDELEIPEIALREALANALVHRDYEHPGSKDQPTRIEIYPDRIEITSFGSLPEGISEKQINENPEDVIPIRRNHIIAEIFRIMQRVELNASGIARIYHLIKEANLPPPKIIQGSNLPTVKVIFFRLSQRSIIEKIFEEVQAGGNITLGNINQIYNSINTLSKLTGIPSNIPPSSTDKFVGRERELERLHQQLQSNHEVVIAAVQGIGGVGKTELAIQYSLLHLQLHSYPGGICWLRARDSNIGLQIIEFATTNLGLHLPDDLELAKGVNWCWQHWQQGNTLIVLDDVNSYSHIKPYLPPQSSKFRVLITTRLKLDLVSSLFLEVLSETDALLLLAQLIGEEKQNQELAQAKELCQRLGYLPLALQLVGRYVKKRKIALASMLRRLEEKGLAHPSLVMEENDPSWTLNIKRGVAAAFELSWSDLSEPAQQLGCLLSLFALAPIPWSLVERTAIDQDQEELEDARVELEHLHLLEGEKIDLLNPLIREFLRNKQNNLAATDEQKYNFCKVMAEVAKEIPQSPTQEFIWSVKDAIPHLTEVAQYLTNAVSDENLIWVFYGLDRFYSGQGLYALAQPWCEQCVSVLQSRLGDEHPDVATSYNNLALLYNSQGQYEQAEPLLIKALELRQRLLGNEHPDVATSYNNLALLYNSQGQYEQAKPLLIKALELRQRLLGNEHPDVATSYNNLALLYNSQGQYEQAEPLLIKALELRQRLLGNEHPDVATSYNNLALLYNSQGQYEQAKPLLIKALELRQRLLGNEHPDVATSYNNLALLYNSQGQYEQAEPLLIKALELRQRLLGNEHPDVATSYNNLALLYNSQGQYEQAEPLLIKALELRQRLLGNEHPDVATSYNDLAGLYFDQGRYSDAEPLYQKSLDIASKSLGVNHPNTITIRENVKSLRDKYA